MLVQATRVLEVNNEIICFQYKVNLRPTETMCRLYRRLLQDQNLSGKAVPKHLWCPLKLIKHKCRSYFTIKSLWYAIPSMNAHAMCLVFRRSKTQWSVVKKPSVPLSPIRWRTWTKISLRQDKIFKERCLGKPLLSWKVIVRLQETILWIFYKQLLCQPWTRRKTLFKMYFWEIQS